MKRITVNLPEQESNGFGIFHSEDEYQGIITHLFHKENGGESVCLEGREMMTDNIQETETHIPFFDLPLSGNVLVTGLGVGMINEYLITIPEIKKVVIVEKYKEVIDMVWPYCKRDERFEIVNEDAEIYIPTIHFDYAWLDHWTTNWLVNHGVHQKDWWESGIVERYSQYCDNVQVWKPPIQ